MKIEEQELTPPMPTPTEQRLISTTSDGVLLGFHQMFQQSFNCELASSVSPTLKRKAGFFSGQESDPYQRSRPNANRPEDDDWHYANDDTMSGGVQFGFEDLFQTHATPCTQKRKQNGFAGQKVSKTARVGLPTAQIARGTEEVGWQYDAKYGLIDKDSILSSDLMKKLSLLGIWGLLKELESKKLDDLNLNSVAHYYDIARDADKMNMNVKWLIKRLDEIKFAIVSRTKAKILESAKIKLLEKTKEMKEKMERLQCQVKEMQNKVTSSDVIINDLNLEINYHTSKFQHLQTTPLSDGLI